MGSRRPETAKEIATRESMESAIAAKLVAQIEAKKRAEIGELRRILNEDQFGYDWWRIRGSWICRRRGI
jgi:hypothetical protein